MGTRQDYEKEFEKCPGTIYLSKGWIDQGAEPLAEFKRYTESYGEENAQWMIYFQYSNYQRVLFIDTGVGNREELAKYSSEVAKHIQADYQEQQGSLRLLIKLLQGEWDEEFVITSPGRMVLQRNFLYRLHSFRNKLSKLAGDLVDEFEKILNWMSLLSGSAKVKLGGEKC